jgi:hypothetical protein
LGSAPSGGLLNVHFQRYVSYECNKHSLQNLP